MSCCDKCAKTGGTCGGARPQGKVHGSGARAPAAVSEGSKALRGVGDVTTVNVAPPFWELALLVIGSIAVGAYGATLYRKKTPVHVQLSRPRLRRIRRTRRSSPNLYRRRR